MVENKFSFLTPKLVRCLKASTGVLIVSLLFFPSAFALNDPPQTFTLDGTLYQSGTTTPLQDTAASVTVQILNPTGNCLLYEEQQTVNTLASKGSFSIHIGSTLSSGKRTSSDPGRTMSQIFQNSVAIIAADVPGQTCTGGAYIPVAGAIRYFRLIVTPSATHVADTLSPDLVIDSVPHAIVAQSLQGLDSSNILQVNNSGSTALTQSNLEALFTTPAYTNLQSILAGNFMKTDSSGASLPTYSSDPSGLSNGDIWFDSTTGEIKYKSAAGVQTVGASGGGGGVSSLTVGSSMSVNGTVAGTISGPGTIDLSNTGVSSGTYTKVTVDTKGRVTAGTISLVEADIPNLTVAGKVSGNTITSGTISGSAAINSSGNLITTGTVSGLNVQATNLRVYNGTNYVQFVAPTLAGIVNFTLPDNDGNPGDVLTSNGSGVLSWASGTTTLAGDVSGSAGTTSVDKIKGKAVTAGSVSGQVMIYDGTAWNNAVMSGDATLSYTGILSLNKVPVSKGGTNASSFGNNHIVATNGTGSALVDWTCSLSQVITFDASGNSACANIASIYGGILNGGNTTGADISIGTNDTKALSIKTNNLIAMTISQSGAIGIGTTAPGAPVDILHLAYPLASTNGIVAISSTDAFAIDKGGTLSFGGNASNGASMYSFGIMGGFKENNTGGNTAGYLAFGTPADGALPTEKMRITSAGLIGIGISAPRTALDVSGAITGKPAVSISAATVDFANNNLAYTSQNCGAFALWNMKDGGSYTFAVQGTTSGTCSFTAFSDGGSAPLTVKLPPDHSATTASKHTIYTFLVLGTTVYTSWIPGY